MTGECGHDRTYLILHRDGHTAWCFICEADVRLVYPWQVVSPAKEVGHPVSRDGSMWRDRLEDIWWHLFWSGYTSWRQDRAYRRYLARVREAGR